MNRFGRIIGAGAGAMLVLTLLAGARPAAAAFSSGLDSVSLGVWDAPSRYFPGQYLEQKAQFYLKKQDYAEALRLFELSGYWADKVAQYNAGIMHFNGIGVPVDRSRGTAWLGIAAQNHDDLAQAALQAAYAELTPGERARADTIYRGLDAKYGDAVALPRALRQYRLDAAESLFGFGVTGPGMVATVGGGRGLEENSVDFVHRMNAQRDALIERIMGRVTVGAVRALDVPPEARRHASHKALQVEPPAHP